MTQKIIWVFPIGKNQYVAQSDILEKCNTKIGQHLIFDNDSLFFIGVYGYYNNIQFHLCYKSLNLREFDKLEVLT